LCLGTLSVRKNATYSQGVGYLLRFAYTYLTNVCIDQSILIVLASKTEAYSIQYNGMM